MPHITQFGKVEQTIDIKSFLILRSCFTLDSVKSKFQRVRFCLSAEFSPIRIAILVYGTDLECVVGFSSQPVKQQLSILNCCIQHAIELYFIEIGIRHFAPCRFQSVSFNILGSNLSCRSSQRTGRNSVIIGRRILEAFDIHHNLIFSNVSSSQLHKKLRILSDYLLFKFTAFRSKFIQIRSSIIEVYILTFLEIIHREHFDQLHFAFAHLSRNFLWFGSNIYPKLSSFLFYKTVEITLCRTNRNLHIVFRINI